MNLKTTSNYKTSKDGTLVPTLCRMVVATCWRNMPSHSGRLDSIQVHVADKIIHVNQTQLKLPSKTGENAPYGMSEHKGPPLANLINSRRVKYITKNITYGIPYLKKDLWNKARPTQQCNAYLSYNPVYVCYSARAYLHSSTHNTALQRTQQPDVRNIIRNLTSRAVWHTGLLHSRYHHRRH